MPINVAELHAVEILDSRARPTARCHLDLGRRCRVTCCGE